MVIRIHIEKAQDPRGFQILSDETQLSRIRRIVLDINGGYAEVEMYDLEDGKSEETSHTLVKHGFVVNRIDPRKP